MELRSRARRGERHAAKRSAGLAASTVNGHLAVLSALLRCAIEWGLLMAAPKVTATKKGYVVK